MRRCELIVVTFGTLGGTATADDYEPLASPPLSPPGFVTLDRADGVTRGGAELSYLFPNATNLPGSTVMRFEAHAQYVDADTGIGGYFSLPIGYLSAAGFNGGASDTTLGDLEIGALYAHFIAAYGVTIVGRAGISLPTAPVSDQSHFVNYAATVSRITDVYLSLPQSTAVRVATSPIWRSGRVFARADFGLDIDSAAKPDRYDTAFRVDAGIGVDLDLVALTAETANIYAYSPKASTTSTPSGSSWIDTVALAARFRAGHVEPYGALVIPLDAGARDVMDVAITVGIDVVR